MRILVAEDDAIWREQLCEMYAEIFHLEKPNIEVASTVPEARGRLKRQSFDLLSLDIVYKEGHQDEPDGRTLLRTAHEFKKAGAVLVITGMHEDKEFKVWLQNDETMVEAMMSLRNYVDKLFPGSNKVFLKKARRDDAANIEEYRKLIGRDIQRFRAKEGLTRDFLTALMHSETRQAREAAKASTFLGLSSRWATFLVLFVVLGGVMLMLGTLIPWPWLTAHPNQHLIKISLLVMLASALLIIPKPKDVYAWSGLMIGAISLVLTLMIL